MSFHRLIQAYSRYLNQIHSPIKESDLVSFFQENPDYEAVFKNAFMGRFGPLPQDVPCALLSDDAKHTDEPAPYRALCRAFQKTVRTNFFFPDVQALALKFVHEDGTIELFVDHPLFQGVILKRHKIARGGLRWSDRQDFRTECWNLMQTQVLKNACIVPSGAKGAFFLKERDSRDALPAYRLFIQAILELSDNLVQNKVVRSPYIFQHYDGEDFYNVVAADKGTASFSDEANSIALRHGYWLGDAFASGGSQGYNHKELAITSRGVWVSVHHHLDKLPSEDIGVLNVIGVGDMAGDIFGNGLLASAHLRLLGAFNYESIFIDPSPDLAASYQERQRLFELTGSRWQDYQAFSPGGQVYARSHGFVPLTPQARELLAIAPDCPVTPDEVIQRLLMMPVDLLWLGGIGTFIQAEKEEKVDDQANEKLRILGHQVGARIIAEGANLGCTQKGRVEYARRGGLLNTDALDNSAGVACSDHEINLKILLDSHVGKGDISVEERNTLLQDVKNDVCSKVLNGNFWQNVALSFAQDHTPDIQKFALKLIDRPLMTASLSKESIQELKERWHLQGLTRPDLACLLAYSKMEIKQALAELSLGGLGNDLVLSYFPDLIQQRFGTSIPQHLLYDLLKTTVLTNALVHTYGVFALDSVSDMLDITIPERVQWMCQFLLKSGAYYKALDGANHGIKHLYGVLGSLRHDMLAAAANTRS